MMSADERLLEVGQIMKAHGLKGQVAVELWTDRTERLTVGETLESDRGPLRIRHVIHHQNTRYLVSFDQIPDRNAAESFRGVVLRAPRLEIDDEDVIWIDELFGAEVVDLAGTSYGTVSDVEANPASDILVLSSGHLVPLTFVVEIEANTRITIDPPEGLFDQ